MEIDDGVFAVIDVETTGLDPAKDRIVEIAIVVTDRKDVLGMWASLVNPGIPIPPDVSAIHGLTDADVADAISFDDAMELAELATQSTALNAAHNAAFDSSFVFREAPFICTKRLAQHLWPKAPTFKNQGLRYYRRLKVDTFGIAPHRTLGDALVTAALLRDLLTCDEFEQRGITSIHDLYQLSLSPILLTTLNFGTKHRGKPMSEVDEDYLRWMLRTVTDMDADLRYSVEHELQKR